MKVWIDHLWKGKSGIGRVYSEVLKAKPDYVEIVNEKEIVTGRVTAAHAVNIAQKIRKSGADLFWSAGFIPPMWSSIPGAITIHDLIHREYGAVTYRLYYDYIIKNLLKNVKIIFTDSEASKQKIHDWSNFPDNKIISVKLGVDDFFSVSGRIYEPGFPYVLYIGNRRKHKNLPRILEAFAKAKLDTGIKLVLSGEPDRETLKLAETFRITQRVTFAGFIADEMLPDYYRGAQILLLPSLEEGFGLPILEAMACGVPVITSNCSSMPEVAGDAALLVDPLQIEEISNAIERIIYDSRLKNNLVMKGKQRAKEFRWEKAAGQFWSNLKSLYGQFS